MLKITSILVLPITFFVLASCATSPYGNFLKNTVTLNQQQIASDTVQQLVTLYPPAKTSFRLEHSCSDQFGQSFVNNLRTQGYALLEFGSQEKLKAQTSSTSTLPLSYVIDQTKGMNLFRITVIVGNQTITRAYHQQDEATVPAGYWTRQE